jgi:hypothetical protein
MHRCNVCSCRYQIQSRKNAAQLIDKEIMFAHEIMYNAPASVRQIANLQMYNASPMASCSAIQRNQDPSSIRWLDALFRARKIMQQLCRWRNWRHGAQNEGKTNTVMTTLLTQHVSLSDQIACYECNHKRKNSACFLVSKTTVIICTRHQQISNS